MIRTQIQLTEEQMKVLKEIASRKKISVAGLIREAVDEFIREEQGISYEKKKERAIRALGKFRSGKHDISVNHDKYLAEAYGQW